jgi:hypothetical protein
MMRWTSKEPPPERRVVVAASLLALAASLAMLALGPLNIGGSANAEGPLTVEVTNSGDSDSSVCPHATECTLRRAIELVNADASGHQYVITFAASAFPSGAPATVPVTGTPMPAIARDRVTVSGQNRGVLISGTLLGPGPGNNGLVVEGNDIIVSSVAIHDFSAACLVIAGARATAGGIGSGNAVGGCDVGIRVSGADATVTANSIGFRGVGTVSAPVSIGVLVSAPGTMIGGTGPGSGNRIGNAQVAVQVGTGEGSPFSGVTIAHNVVGKNVLELPAPVGKAVLLRQPSNGTVVQENLIANASKGIAVSGDVDGVSVTGNRFAENRFQSLTGLAIDLGDDGIRNANDPGDVDNGPNSMLNHPVIIRAVQAGVTGTAGVSCHGCLVNLYFAMHTPGSPNDYGTVPVPGGSTIADAQGNFAFPSPQVAAGQWLVAIVTDGQGNTSEFGPSTRVGTGVVQCPSEPLEPGWNHLAYFGPAITLGTAYPANGAQAGAVSAIYKLVSGTGLFQSWLGATTAGQTLFSLTPGDVYWFLADFAVEQPGGLTLTTPLPVVLKPGWNDFVYIGATADVRDALSSISGHYTEVYRFLNRGEDAGWQGWGNATTPDWARGFTEMTACATYQVFVLSEVTLTPLQP